MSANNERSTSKGGINPPTKRLGIHDLEKIKLNIPPGSLPAGIMIVVVMTSSGSQVGYIDQTQMPKLFPISDLTRLNGVPKMIGTGEAVDNRSRQGDIVKIVAKRVSEEETPNFGPGAPKAIGDAVALSLVLKQNTDNMVANVSRQPYNGIAKAYLTDMSYKALSVLDGYIKHQTTSGGLKKTIRDFVEEIPGIPMWVFTHLTTKGWIPDSPHDSIAELLFPKNISKGIALRVNEWRSEPVLNALGLLLAKSKLLLNATQSATLDALIGSTAKQRGVKAQAALEATYIPLLPLWDLKDNVLKKRTSNPIANREGDLAPLSNLIGRIFATSVGTRPRSLTSRTFWSVVAGFVPDNTNNDPGSNQWRESEPFDELDTNGTPLDKVLLAPGTTDGKMVKNQLFYFLTEMVPADPRLPAILGIAPKNVIDDADIRAIKFDPSSTLALTDKFKKYVVKTTTDRARGTIALDLTDDELALIANPDWVIRDAQGKDRKFPLGDAPTSLANQLLAAVRPHKTDRTLDRHFSGLYSTLTELFSSFNHPAITDRAVSIVRSAMTRLKGEGLFFSSDALTGVGGELFTANGDEQLFADI